MTADRFRITDEDVDYIAEALIDSLRPVADRAATLPGPPRCQLYLCSRGRSHRALIKVAHPEHDTPETVEVEMCQTHSEEWATELHQRGAVWDGRPVVGYRTERLGV